MHMGRSITVFWDKGKLGSSVMLFYLLLFSLLSFPMSPTDSMPNCNQKPVSIKTLTCKAIYAELISRIYKKPTAQQNIERKLHSVTSQTSNLDVKKIYMFPSTNTRMFQYRLLNNILYFNKCLCKMKLVESPICSQCRTVDETSFHFFSACPVTLRIWEELKKWLSPEIRLPPLTPQNAILGIVEDESYETDDIKLICRDAPTPPNFFYVRDRLKLVQKTDTMKNAKKVEVQYRFCACAVVVSTVSEFLR